MKIRLIGIRNALGVGVHYTNISNALQRIYGIGPCIEEVDSTSQPALLHAASQSQPEDINICFVSIPLQHHFRGTNIQWIVFESTRVAPHLHECLNQADQIWVPSEWGRNILLQNGFGSKYIRVVPEGVDENFTSALPHVKNKTFTYLSVGKYEQRKGIQETIEAFKQAWGNDPTKQLWLKTNRCPEIENQIGTSKNISVLDSNMDMTELYQKCHVFVLPTRGEGWGLPLIEAAACGLPIITTMYSGQTEFLQHIPSSVLPVDYVMTPITCPDFQQAYPLKL